MVAIAAEHRRDHVCWNEPKSRDFQKNGRGATLAPSGRLGMNEVVRVGDVVVLGGSHPPLQNVGVWGGVGYETKVATCGDGAADSNLAVVARP